MRAQSIIAKILNRTVGQIHGARREVLYAAFSSALSGQALSVTALGRRLDSGVDETYSRVDPESAIAEYDRLIAIDQFEERPMITMPASTQPRSIYTNNRLRRLAVPIVFSRA